MHNMFSHAVRVSKFLSMYYRFNPNGQIQGQMVSTLNRFVVTKDFAPNFHSIMHNEIFSLQYQLQQKVLH